MAATAATKKKSAPALPEPVEVTFTLLKEKETKGTYRWAEEPAEDGSVVIGQIYTRKDYFDGYVPSEEDTLTITIQVNQNS